ALQPLIAEAGRAVRPLAVDLGERLTLLGGARDARSGLVRRCRWDDDRGCARGRGAARAAFVARGLLHPDRVADFARERDEGLAGGAGDGLPDAVTIFALQPLVGEAGRFVCPSVVGLGERLALLGGSGDRRRTFIRRRWGYHDRGC